MYMASIDQISPGGSTKQPQFMGRVREHTGVFRDSRKACSKSRTRPGPKVSLTKKNGILPYRIGSEMRSLCQLQQDHDAEDYCAPVGQ